MRKVSNGVITTVAGAGLLAFGGDYGPASAAELNVPQSVAVDGAGNVYVADSGSAALLSEGRIPSALHLLDTGNKPHPCLDAESPRPRFRQAESFPTVVRFR